VVHVREGEFLIRRTRSRLYFISLGYKGFDIGAIESAEDQKVSRRFWASGTDKHQLNVTINFTYC
jgi:hypothetical protein